MCSRYGAINPTSRNIAQFICYLLIAMLASRLKVNLPGITGTMSVNFLFILLGILELSFAETSGAGLRRNPHAMFLPRPSEHGAGHVQPAARAFAIALAFRVYHVPLLSAHEEPARCCWAWPP